MNYYLRHLGDYARDTGHLSALEHGVYTLLMDRYYATEKPIGFSLVYRIARATTQEERAAVDSVLEQFFTREGEVFVHGRIQEEIERAARRITAARENGRAGGRPKKNPLGFPWKPDGMRMGSETETQSKANRNPDESSPDSIHQIPNTDSLRESVGELGEKPEETQRVCVPRETPGRSTARLAHRLPEDFTLTDERRAVADTERVQPERTFAKFCDYWRAQPGVKGRKLDWDATWRNWCRTDADRNQGRQPARPNTHIGLAEKDYGQSGAI